MVVMTVVDEGGAGKLRTEQVSFAMTASDLTKRADLGVGVVAEGVRVVAEAVRVVVDVGRGIEPQPPRKTGKPGTQVADVDLESHSASAW